MIEHGFLSDDWKLRIPKFSCFDIETLEEKTENVELWEQKLVSIAFCSELDKKPRYWVIDHSRDDQRQLIGIKLLILLYK